MHRDISSRNSFYHLIKLKKLTLEKINIYVYFCLFKITHP